MVIDLDALAEAFYAEYDPAFMDLEEEEEEDEEEEDDEEDTAE